MKYIPAAAHYSSESFARRQRERIRQQMREQQRKEKRDDRKAEPVDTAEARQQQ